MGSPKLKAIEGRQPGEDRVVKPELNLEQWPLFVPSQARGRGLAVRTIEHIQTRPNGDTITDSVIIGFCEHGTLTAKDQRVLYAMFQNWTEKGTPLSYCYYSTYRLAQILKLQEGKMTQESILESLRRLHAVTITFKSCFHNAETGDVYEDEEPIHIVSELKIRIRKRLKDGRYEPTKSEGYFLFHPRVLKNLIRNYTRPVLFDVVLSLKSDTAQLVYALVDRQLSKKHSYNITTKNLFDEIGLEGKEYRYASTRRRAIEKPVSELIGKPLSSGGIIGTATIEPTKDNTDFKVTFQKEARSGKKTEHLTPAHSKGAAELPETGGEKSLVQRLTGAGVTENVACELVMLNSEECERQLEALPHRKGIEDAGAYLVRAIRDRYSLPAKVEAKQVREKAAKEREAVEQKRAEQVALLQPAYESYVRERLFEIEQEHREEFQAFQQSEAKKRRIFEKGNTARSLEAFESEESRIGRAILFFLNSRTCPIVGFDEWERDRAKTV